MFYKFTVCYKTGTRLSGYAQSDKSESAIKKGIAKQYFGQFTIELEKFGKKFPPVNSDYIITI